MELSFVTFRLVDSLYMVVTQADKKNLSVEEMIAINNQIIEQQDIVWLLIDLSSVKTFPHDIRLLRDGAGQVMGKRIKGAVIITQSIGLSLWGETISTLVRYKLHFGNDLTEAKNLLSRLGMETSIRNQI